MKPKEKAEELFVEYLGMVASTGGTNNIEGIAKQCALFAVDLRLESDFVFTSIEYGESSLEYWQQVKNEIEKL